MFTEALYSKLFHCISNALLRYLHRFKKLLLLLLSPQDNIVEAGARVFNDPQKNTRSHGRAKEDLNNFLRIRSMFSIRVIRNLALA